MITAPRKDEILFVPLGGAGEIGMNLYLYGFDGKWIAVDMGITFGDDADPAVDVVMADPAFLVERKKDLAGIVLTHGHEDHLGAVPLLWSKFRCPVYATPFTAAFLRRKLDEAGLTKEVPLHVVPLGGRITVGPFDIQYIHTTHSIPEPNALAIRTGAGTVLHTGDYKFDPDPMVGEVADEAALRQVGDEGVLAMVGDSTNVFNKGEAGSESAVRKSLTELFGKYEHRIAVACFASNIARLESIAVAAAANDRHVCLVGRSLLRMDEVARETGYLSGVAPFLREDEAGFLPNNKVLYICTGSQGERMAALARIAHNSHRHVSLGRGDVVIFSSRTIPGHEKSVIKLHNQLARHGVEIVTSADHFVHVSGHPCRNEVERMYGLIRPRIAIPVHGEIMHLQEHAALAKACGVEHSLVVENGAIVRLGSGEPEIVGEAPVGRLSLEGKRLVPMTSDLLRGRKKSIYDGSAVMTIVMDSRGDILGEPQLTVQGILDQGADEETIFDIIDSVCDEVEDLPKVKRKDDDEVMETARRAVRRQISERFRKKPVTTIHLVRV